MSYLNMSCYCLQVFEMQKEIDIPYIKVGYLNSNSGNQFVCLCVRFISICHLACTFKFVYVIHWNQRVSWFYMAPEFSFCFVFNYMCLFDFFPLLLFIICHSTTNLFYRYHIQSRVPERKRASEEQPNEWMNECVNG